MGRPKTARSAGYFYDSGFHAYDFGPGHPFSPDRVRRTHELLEAYGAFGPEGWLDLRILHPARRDQVEPVHDRSYLDALEKLNDGQLRHSAIPIGLGTGDTPVFPGIWDASLLIVGASIDAAEHVRQTGGRAMNIAGGLHHAHRNRAAGFCVLNDLAAAIHHLLNSGVERVAYVDIDAHHGDGVQEAFYNDPRVLTISLHETGRTLYPGTGEALETGVGPGEGFCINIPLRAGTGNEVFLWAVDAAVMPALDAYRPEILVTQLGCDAHIEDPLPHLRLTTAAYEAVFHRFDGVGLPWMATGGGGYNLDAVPRVWTLACAAMAGRTLDDRLPESWASQYGGVTLRDPAGPGPSAETVSATRAFAEEAVRVVERQVLPRLAG